jgi:coenzyme PQQ precursor peptide PqqA
VADLATWIGYGYTPRYLESRRWRMSWTTPTLVEICVGLEINGYLPAEF